MSKLLFVKPLLLPSTVCVDAKNYTPTETLTNFLGSAKSISKTEVPITFMLDTLADRKNLMDFYSQVQLRHDGYFLAELPIFTDKRTYLFRFDNILNHNFLGKTFSAICDAWCCWEYADGVIDTTPPTITILDNNPISITLNGTYTDAGATATDDKDGDITENIVTVNNVDTSILGDYAVTYTVKDSSSNETIATRTVQIVDVQMWRYIRIGQNGNDVENSSTATHFVEAYSKNHDGLYNAPTRAVVLNEALEEQGHDTTLIVDGIVNLNDYIGEQSSVFRWLLIDYNTQIDIKTISVWRYFGDPRTYYNTTIQVSNDNQNWTTLQDSSITGAYVETEDGFTVDLDNL